MKDSRMEIDSVSSINGADRIGADSIGLEKAAAVYQSIQAPSDLRAKVLQGAAEKEGDLRQKRRGITRRKIYSLGMLSACAAVLVVSVHLGGMQDELMQMTQETVRNHPAADRQCIEEQIAGNFYHTAGEWIDLPDEDGNTADVFADASAGSDESGEAGEAVSAGKAASGEKKEAAGGEGVVFEKMVRKETAVPAPCSDGQERGLPRAVPYRGKDAEESGDKTNVSLKPTPGTAGVSVGKLLPGILGQGESISDWEIRLVDAGESSCTLEVNQGGRLTTMTLSKGESSSGGSQWEIKQTENISKN